MRERLMQLITNPKTGLLSLSDTALAGAFVASTLVMLWCALAGSLSEWLFCGYLTAWVVQCQASKQASIKRDRESRHDADN